MTPPPTPPVVWTVLAVRNVVDGDTLDATVRDDGLGVLDGWTLTATADVRIRLIHLDTPERGELGYAHARADLTAWLAEHEPAGLVCVALPERDRFGRYLADVHPAGDRAGTVSQWMMTAGNDGRGWPPWQG